MSPVAVTSVYACIIAVLATGLTVRVICIRRARRISLGTGDDDVLTRAVRAHGNCVEHATLALVLLALLELAGGSPWLLHGAGALLVGGRCVHAWSLVAGSFRARTLGMALTFASYGLLVPANLLVEHVDALHSGSGSPRTTRL